MTKYNPIGIPASVLNERRSRIRLSICFHAEKTTIKPTERPVNPMSAIDVLSDNGNNANKDIDITESPKPKVARVREPKKTNKTTKLRSEEHTSELQSRGHLVCRLLLEKKTKRRHRT